MLEYSGQSNMKRVWLECGGKAPNIVIADVADLDRAATAAAYGIFFNQGEMCSAASRLVVHESVTRRDAREDRRDRHAPWRPAIRSTRRRGSARSSTRCSSTRVLGYIESGQQEGAKLRLGGKRARKDSGGYFVEPTVFDDVSHADEDRARGDLRPGAVDDHLQGRRGGGRGSRNDVSYGLTAAVWTRDITTAHRVAKALRAGTVYVNCYDADDITVPFGGFKQSGNGRDKSLHAMDKYTELKTTWIDLS